MKLFFNICKVGRVSGNKRINWGLSNIPTSSIGGGSIMGGVFISSFLKNKYKNKWLHIDIACVSFIKNSWKYHNFGATGFGVKSSVKLIIRLTKPWN